MKNCIKRSVVGVLALLSLVTVRANPAEDGAAAFAKGDYAVAARAYETAVATTGPDAGLYFNLAQAQLKDGQRPQAALNLHRAIMLDPRMIDARMALSDLERSQGVPRAKSDWRTTVAEKAPLQILVVTGCALAWLGAFLLLFAIFKSGRKFQPFLASGILLVVGAAFFLAGTLSDPRIQERHAAVVLAGEGVSLLSAPADQSATVARLPGGASLRILQRSGEWTYCQAPAGEKGWAPSKALEFVVPSA